MWSAKAMDAKKSEEKPNISIQTGQGKEKVNIMIHRGGGKVNTTKRQQAMSV